MLELLVNDKQERTRRKPSFSKQKPPTEIWLKFKETKTKKKNWSRLTTFHTYYKQTNLDFFML